MATGSWNAHQKKGSDAGADAAMAQAMTATWKR